MALKPLKAWVESLDEVPEDDHERYRRCSSGGFVPNIEESEGWNLEDVRGIKANRDEAIQRHKTLKQKFGDLDPEEARTALKTLKDLEKETDDDKSTPASNGNSPDPEMRVLQQQLKTLQAQLDSEKTARETERTRSISSKRNSWATEALAEHTEDVAVLKPHLISRMTPEDGTDGETVFRVRGDDGEPIMVSTGGSTDPKVILKEYVATKMRPEFPRNFPATKASGGGMVTSDVASDSDGKKHIKAGDMDAIGENIDDIAAGKVIVDD